VSDNGETPELTEEDLVALRAGAWFQVEPDPTDERYMLVSFRRPSAGAVDVTRRYEGDEVAAKLAKFCVASLEGMGLGVLDQAEDGRLYMVADVTSILELEKLTDKSAGGPASPSGDPPAEG
jgi:hypothetical protein